MWKAWAIGLVGVGAVVAPFAEMTMAAYAWSHWTVGALAILLGVALVRERPIEGCVTGMVGLWMFVAGFTSDLLRGDGLWWNNLVVGSILLLFGFSAMRSLQLTPDTRSRAR
jgi:hypothetical protein